ncbi:Nucleoprotein TPR [Fasciola hepatica]|uniref:Nucleoprotein TPR n=1 Tax=Fasciola hepatica TaxID=6192 RepID=A0A4E0RGP6_FASHE|nr:Nucleoprotein TPR [Fasciola hepatica]
MKVQFLLREVEVLRGTVVEEPGQDLPDSTDTLNKSQLDKIVIRAADLDQMFTNTNSSAAEVIDEHLVTWRSLGELQSQNQRLLCIARDLATQLEEHEREEKETAARVSELTLRVETLSGELDVVRMTAREARTETQAVTRQRDMYRALLNRYDIEVSRLEDESMEEKATCESANENAIQLFDSDVPSGPGGKHPAARSSSDGNTNTTNAERLEETLASLDTEFKRYREDKLESDKIYTTTIEQLRKESSEARLLNQKLAAQLDFSHEKLRIMETNISGYKQEITVLREMNARYSTSAAASEAELARLREDLLRTSDKLLEVEVDARHSARQLELARANETRWKQENEALRRQDQMHTQLMHQLEAIQGNLEQRESHDRSLLDRRVSQLEKQLTEAQSAFTEASQSCKTIKQTLEQELELTRQKLADEQAEAERLRTQLTASEQELNELQPKKDAKAVTTSEESNEHVMHEIAMESASRIRELQSEVDGLRMRLDSARQQTEQMRALATEAETRLVETTEENKQLEQRLSQELNENKQSKSWCEFLEAQLDLEKKERQNLVNENIRTTEEAHHMNAELRRELTDLQSDLESVRARCESALQLEAGAKAEIEAHERFAQEAREKYERELALHAQDVEASSLTEARKQADDLKTQLGDLQRHCSAAERKAQAATDELTAQNTQWQSERERLTEKLQQSDKDQSLLQEQLIRLTQQLISLRRVMEHTEEKDSMPSPSSTDAADSSGLGDLKTSEDLMQLVNYLRRQKNIAEASCDATAAENSRLLLRIASLEEQTDHLRTELNRERKASELATETTQRHSELMERVEQLNLVTESNRLLRHERETLRENLTEMENQVSKPPLGHNERDELQRKLRRTEEELQHVQNKLNELRGELEGRIRKFEQDLTEANNSRQDAEKRCSEYSVQCDSLRKDLETRETTVVKLREIGRKYRQETETLRRQLAANQSDESHRQSIEEALTEARADVVNLRADLSVERTQKSQLAADLQDISQIIEELKTNTSFSAIMTSIPTTSSDSMDSVAHSVVGTLRATFTALSTEFDRLHQQAEVQRERLLRLMLIESQLTKALRENTELRSRLTEIHLSQPIRPVQPSVSANSSCVTSMVRKPYWLVVILGIFYVSFRHLECLFVQLTLGLAERFASS